MRILLIDRERQRVEMQGAAVPLGHMEYQLVELLAGRQGQPFTRNDILNALHRTLPNTARICWMDSGIHRRRRMAHCWPSGCRCRYI